MIFSIFILFLFTIFIHQGNKSIISSGFDLTKVEFLKSLLPYGIMIAHCHIYEDFEIAAKYIVGLFLFCSGYGLMYKKKKSQLFFKNFLLSSKKLLFPLIVPIIIYFVVYIIYKDHSIYSFFKKSLKFQVILPYTWFILTLLILRLVFYLANIIKNNIFFYAVYTCGVLISMVVLKILNVGAWTYLSNISFVTGSIICHLEDKKNIINIFSSSKWIMYLFLFFLLLFISYLSYTDIPGISYFNIPLYCICIYSVLSLWPKIFSITITVISKISYELYLYQSVAFLLLPSDLINFNNFIYLIALLLLTTILAYLGYKLNKLLLKAC